MRLIDADALLELVQFRTPIDNQNAEVIAGCVDITRRLIEARPTIDAVEVVRCKDCKKRGTEDCAMFFDNGYHLLDWTKNNDFCSWGEREEECD